MSMKYDRCGEVFNPEPPDEDGQQSAWTVRMRERKVRLVATDGQLLFRLVDCNRAGQNRNKDEEVRT